MDNEDIIEITNKYEYRLNIGLCLEELNNEFICSNKVIPGEDLCKYHSDEQQTVDIEGYIVDKKLYKKYISNLLYYDKLYLTNIENNIKKDYEKDISYSYIIDICTIENTLNTIDKYKEKEIFYNNKYKKDNISFKFFKKGSIRYTWYNGKIRGESHKRGNPFHCDDCSKTENINDYKIGSLVVFYCKECAMENVKYFIEFNKRLKNENYI